MANDVNMNLTVRDGITTCTNNSGVEIIYKVPRNKLATCKNIDELNHGGIYFLFGERDGRQMTFSGNV